MDTQTVAMEKESFLEVTVETKVTKETKDTEDPADRRLQKLSLILGVIITFLVCIFDATGISCLQLMEKLPPDFEINSTSFTLGLVCNSLYLLFKRKLPKFPKRKLVWLFALCVVFLTDNVCLYNHEASFLPLGSIGSLGYAFCIIYSVILSRIFLKEKVTCHKGVAVLITLTGLVFTIMAHVPRFGNNRDTDSNVQCLNGDHNNLTNTLNTVYNTSHLQDKGFHSNDVNALLKDLNLTSNSYLNLSKQSYLTETHSNQERTSYNQLENISSVVEKSHNNSMKDIAESSDLHHTECIDPSTGHHSSFWSQFVSMSLLAIACLCSSLETVMLSGSRLKNESPPVLGFYIFLMGTLFLLPATFLIEEPILPVNSTDFLYLLGHAISSAGLTFCYIIAAQLLMPMVLSIIESFGIPLMFCVQMGFLQSVSKPTNIWLQVTGILLVFSMTVALPIMEYRQLKEVAKQDRVSKV